MYCPQRIARSISSLYGNWLSSRGKEERRTGKKDLLLSLFFSPSIFFFFFYFPPFFHLLLHLVCFLAEGKADILIEKEKKRLDKDNQRCRKKVSIREQWEQERCISFEI